LLLHILIFFFVIAKLFCCCSCYCESLFLCYCETLFFMLLRAFVVVVVVIASWNCCNKLLKQCNYRHKKHSQKSILRRYQQIKSRSCWAIHRFCSLRSRWNRRSLRYLCKDRGNPEGKTRSQCLRKWKSRILRPSSRNQNLEEEDPGPKLKRFKNNFKIKQVKNTYILIYVVCTVYI